MAIKVEQHVKYQAVTYKRVDGSYDAILTDLKRKITVKENGLTEEDAYWNAARRMIEEQELE
jgi:hypothetical protein